MEPKEAIAILLSMLERKTLSEEDKEALIVAVGALDSMALAKNRLRSIRDRKDNKKGTKD